MSTMHWGYLDTGNLAGIYYEQSQLDMAILHYKQAINCDSTFIEAYNNLGNALKDAGHVEEAINFYRSCLALQPNHPQALSSLGNIYMDCNMMSVAASFYKATLAVTTGISAPFNNLAIIYKQQTAADGLVNRGNTLKEIGRVTEAIQDYIRAVNIRPTMPEAHAILASAYKDSFPLAALRDASVQPGWGLEPGYLATTAFIGAAQCLGRLFRVVCLVVGRDGDWETANVGGTIG
ncbi:hypothetical protein ZIOFF_019716 [Zingiber officinale]|uniref:UDP-N-acetylglucosamine--peptide N-acetylglucosaminyltransferase SPINDLY n=1 Tax=Zingiber officinale TaxID=94328 RepID=A0A8J5H7D6_ZINOF|nr:hypothetical protein ZIOFF_019716 [Zingiber officinale]